MAVAEGTLLTYKLISVKMGKFQGIFFDNPHLFVSPWFLYVFPFPHKGFAPLPRCRLGYATAPNLASFGFLPGNSTALVRIPEKMNTDSGRT